MYSANTQAYEAYNSTWTLDLICCHWLFHQIFNCKIPIPKSKDWEVVRGLQTLSETHIKISRFLSNRLDVDVDVSNYMYLANPLLRNGITDALSP